MQNPCWWQSKMQAQRPVPGMQLQLVLWKQHSSEQRAYQVQQVNTMRQMNTLATLAPGCRQVSDQDILIDSTVKLQGHSNDSAHKLKRQQRHDPIATDTDILKTHAKHTHKTPLALLTALCHKARQPSFAQQGATDLNVL